MSGWGPVVWLVVCAVALTPAVAVAQMPGAPNTVAAQTPAPPTTLVAQSPAPPNTVVAADAEDPLAELQHPGDTVLLSDEQGTTRWAHAQDTAKIHSSPRADAGIARLHFLTEDGAAEVYIVLDGRSDSSGRRWLHIRFPTRANRRTGWVRADALSRLYVVRTQLVVDRSALRAKLYRKGDLVWSAPAGVGRSGTPTPRGSFWIREFDAQPAVAGLQTIQVTDATQRSNVGTTGSSRGSATGSTVNPPPPPPPSPPATPPPCVPPPGPAAPGQELCATPVGPSSAPAPAPASGTAQISGKTGCATQNFNVTVTGRHIRRVVFSLDGKNVSTLMRPNRGGRYVLAVRPGRLKLGTHRVIAQTTFTAASRTRTRSLRVVFQRCARISTAPRFTG